MMLENYYHHHCNHQNGDKDARCHHGQSAPGKLNLQEIVINFLSFNILS